ncbi:undecaprenyl-diphosphate phosphatase [Amnibacterium sp. CER49]|uniref:undecaprenyl-diphosphate phosphatase n=1 Tax=Amnibacterium sp. CER49 TaxID=3039161 RepID=UPI00244CE46D|nr:undecaprenyl-diphosphate phosphatase [Amnibacterium sp. CER49]MDH2442378.1 undecaprenyl-diphosphate phosphatase [Amnibacterium sp. CER49]
MTYLEAIVMGALQGVSELFPVSSLGHSVLIPALVGGQWAKDLSVSAPESPYLAFIVGLHVATALALILFFWRDWLRLIGGLISSIRHRRIATTAEKMIWLLILATIPVGIAGLLLEHLFRTVLGKPLPAAAFLVVNGVILFVGERLRRRGARAERAVDGLAVAPGNPVEDDMAISRISIRRGVLIGATEILALLPGISRSGVVMVAGMAAGLTHREAARFSFLLATPVILAAGVLKVPDLLGPLGAGIRGQMLAGSVASFIGALLAVAFLDRYFRTKTLLPFAVYCVVAGVLALVVLLLRPA